MRMLWLGFVVVLVCSFAVLGWVGSRIYQEAPPLPDRVVTSFGETVNPRSGIHLGQNIWQSKSDMNFGSFWG